MLLRKTLAQKYPRNVVARYLMYASLPICRITLPNASIHLVIDILVHPVLLDKLLHGLIIVQLHLRISPAVRIRVV